MPFGDPRPLRRRLSRKDGLGQKGSTASPRLSDRQPSTPLKVGLIVADCLEVTPRLMNPLEVRIGARQVEECDVPKLPTVVIDVVNRDDGQEYQILVTRKPKRRPDKGTSTNSRS